MRWILLLVALASAALGLLTVVETPNWVSWKLAVLAGEFGYWVAILPLAAVLSCLFAQGWRAALTRVIGLAAVILLVQPCLQAWWIGRGLPDRLAAAFGGSGESHSAFSFTALFARGPATVPAETLNYAPGLDLDFYRASGSGAAPCVLVIHGGGWNDGDRGQIPTLNFRLAADGYAVADISYRLAPRDRWPAQREDVAHALRFLKSNATRLGLDPRRIVLLGRSAGGQIAEATAYAIEDPDIKGVIGLYAPADMNFAYRYGREDDALHSPELLREFLGGTPVAAPANYASASSYGLVRHSSPPTLLVHGRLDALVWYRQSRRLDARLAEASVPHLLVTLPWATHAVEYHQQGPAGQLTLYSLEWFLRAITVKRIAGWGSEGQR